MKILCATDFSTQATVTSHIAARLARKLGGSLVLVHAIEPWILGYPPEMAETTYNLMTRDYDKWAKEQLASLGAALRREGANVEGVLEEGYADQVILRRARELGANLVVLGAHGRGRAEPFHIGRTAERVLERAECPVLVVNENAIGLQRWLGGDERLQVFAAVDDTAASNVVIEWAKLFRAATACDLRFVQFFWPPEEANRRGMSAAEPADELAIGVSLQARLQRHIGPVGGEGLTSILAKPTWSRYGDAVAHTAEDMHADLIIAGAHQRHGLERLRFGSTAREILREARLPVLYVPARLKVSNEVQPLPEYRRVLVPTDLSEAASAAMAHGYALVRELGGVVELLHVTEDRDHEPEDFLAIEKQLRARIPLDAERLGLTTRITIVEDKNPADTIAAYAERFDVDAICMTTKVKPGIAKLALGSVTQGVTEKSRRPVVVIHAPPA
jgi:nucleotide-binding universal stress UspA family protein